MNQNINHILEQLNPPQREAVVSTEGPLLVLAGAGSGKTRVLACRAALIVYNGLARPYQILALTFTNKAAGELRTRISAMVGVDGNMVIAGTFHSIFARIMRQEGRNIGVNPNFIIIDDDDKYKLLKEIIKAMNIPNSLLNPGLADWLISDAKNRLIDVNTYANNVSSEKELLVAQVYEKYQARLQRMDGLDFDDLLMKPYEAFKQYPEFLERLQNRFKYVMVDEFQDTNPAQYMLVKQIAVQHRNIGVVGDDDQAIYGWRGATVANILNFQKDWHDAKVVRLEQNYRSHKEILDIAWSVIKHNKSRFEKRLWTEQKRGSKTLLIEAFNEEEEAQRFVSYVQNDARLNGRSLNNYAILYRTNAQSLPFERALRAAGLPYQVVGGLRFYERKEIKDLIAYLRVLINTADDVSLLRIINYPPRGIGHNIVSKMQVYSSKNNISLYQAGIYLLKSEELSLRQKGALIEFYKLIDEFQSKIKVLSMMNLVSELIERIDLKERLTEEEKEDKTKAESKVGNIINLVNEIAKYELENPKGSLEGFLEEVALVTDIDRYDETQEKVNLLTIHSAKGLEFPVVLIGGLEDGLLPLIQNDKSNVDIEEERRLFYVAVTRAMHQLILGYARRRLQWSKTYWDGEPSRFLFEIPPELLSITKLKSPQKDYDDIDNKLVRPDDLRRGLLVKHPKFGVGIVINFRRSGLDSTINVDFDSVGIKTLILRYTNLELIE